MASENDIRELILSLVATRGTGKTICPSEVARALEKEDARWQALMPRVRRHAVSLAREGEIAIFRKGKPVDPDDFKGVYRLGLPLGE